MKYQRSRILVLTSLVLAGTMALAGCGRSDGEAAAPEPTETETIPVSPGFDGETITLGLVTVTSGPLAPVTAPQIAAQQAWVNWINEQGGIDGKYKVKLNITDSAYNPAQAIQQYERTKGEVVMYADLFGTPIAQSILPQLKTDQILAAAGTADGSLFRERETTLKFTPYESQLLGNIDYYLQHGELGEDAIFCGVGLEGPLFESVERSFDAAQSEMGINFGTNVSVANGATDATPQVLQLQSANCDVLAIQAVNATTVALAEAASKLGYAPQFLVTSTGYIPVFEDNPLYEYFVENLLQTADVVPFGDTSASGMADLVAAHEQFADDFAPTIAYVQAWAGMLAVESILKEAIERGDLSHSGLVEASNALSTFDLKGIGPNWVWGEPADRRAPDSYTVYQPDASDPSGVSVVQAGVKAPQAAIGFPY